MNGNSTSQPAGAAESDPRIRWAMPADAPAIARVHIASWRVAYRGLLPDRILAGLSVAGRTEQWQRMLAEGGERMHTLVVERGEEIAGFATLSMPCRDAEEAEDVAEIPALYLSPDRFGQGLGTRLIAAAEAELAARGYREAVLWMLDGNEPAAAFYARRGWRRDGGRRGSQYFPAEAGLAEVRWRRDLRPG